MLTVLNKILDCYTSQKFNQPSGSGYANTQRGDLKPDLALIGVKDWYASPHTTRRRKFRRKFVGLKGRNIGHFNNQYRFCENFKYKVFLERYIEHFGSSLYARFS